MANNKQKIVVGISGGVDSAVTALLLKQQGFEVIGVFMQNWEADREDPHCSAAQDLSDARAVCDRLDIPLHTVNFAKEYWQRVFQHCLDEFAAGRTPNPDIGCNREIKFDVFQQHAMAMGASHLATGHYAQLSTTENGRVQLLSAIDETKDQAYFLYALNQQQLRHALFPLGALRKKQVREIAQQHQLINHAKKDSTGICFIGEKKFQQFLQEFILAQPGDIETEDGRKLGTHAGVMFYTLGQRKGLQIGGVANTDEKPWYVIDKDPKRNVLIVGQGVDHPRLFSKALVASQLNWISGEAPQQALHIAAKIRHLQDNQACILQSQPDGSVQVEFEQPQRAVTAGQSVVFYDNGVCLGGGIIQSRI